MIDSNPMRAVCNYGSSAAYKDPPTEEQIRCGVIPLDSLPAAWWNWLWNETNSAVNEARSAMTTVITELNNVLSCAGITPQSECMDQLYNAIVCLRQATASATVAGSVKSSNTCGQVSVDNNGFMTANGLGNASNLSTTAKTNVVAAINELKSVYDSCFTDTAGSIQALENGKLGCSACAADSALLGGTAKSGLLTGVSFTNGCVGVTVGGTTRYVALGSAASCSTSAFLAANGCAADSAKLGGTSKGGLLTALSCANNTISLTVGGTTCTASLTIPAACFGTAENFTKYVCTTTSGTAGVADCAVTMGLARSYTLCSCPQNTGSYDRRTYSKVGTYQNQGACAGMTYIDTCIWQCCYSGSAGVTTSTNKRWCFCGNGTLYTPGAVEARSGTFGDMLVANRTGSANAASVTFCNCNGLLGHLATNTKDGRFIRYKSDNATSYTILDTSAAVTVAQGGTGATTAANARTNLGLGSAATCAATAFRSCTWTPTCVACAGQVMIGGAASTLGTAAKCADTAFRPSSWAPSCVACAGQVMIGGAASTLGTAAKYACGCFASSAIASCPGLNCTGTSNYVVTTKVCCAEIAEYLAGYPHHLCYSRGDNATHVANQVTMVWKTGRYPVFYICNDTLYDVILHVYSTSAFYCDCYNALSSGVIGYNAYAKRSSSCDFYYANLPGKIVPAKGALAYVRSCCVSCYFCCSVYKNNLQWYYLS